MKYSPKLSLLKKGERERGVAKKNVLRWIDVASPPKALDVSFAWASLQEEGGGDRETGRGSIKCSQKLTPNSVPVSRATAPKLPKYSANSAALSPNIQSTLSLVLLTPLVLAFSKIYIFSFHT